MRYGVNLLGYFEHQSGVAEMARKLHEMLEFVGIPHVCNPVSIAYIKYDGLVPQLTRELPYCINIVSFPLVETPTIISQYGDIFDRYTIGIQPWETDNYPPPPDNILKLYNEVWTVSEFCRRAISKSIPQPVKVVNFPTIPQASLGWNDDRPFTVLYMFSVDSCVSRKNPALAIEAFRRAFGDRQRLILKSNTANREQYQQIIDDMTGYAPNIIHIPDNYSDYERWRLLNECDVYLSPHASEGLGFTILEAMSLGKPVVATGYSGNMDYMDNTNSVPVSYDMVPIPDNTPPYSGTGHWATPNVDEMASALRRLSDDVEYRNRIGEAAKATIEHKLSLASCSTRLKSLLPPFVATYGALDTFKDVTAKIITSSPYLTITEPYNSIFGDPIPGVAKTLTIIRQDCNITLEEDQEIDIPLHPANIRVYYDKEDVTVRFLSLEDNGTITIDCEYNLLFGDSCPGTPKTLTIVTDEETFSIPENHPFKFGIRTLKVVFDTILT